MAKKAAAKNKTHTKKEVMDEAVALAVAEMADRMVHYVRPGYLACPNCAAAPVVCMQKRPGYAAYRCRQCGHRWEVK